MLAEALIHKFGQAEGLTIIDGKIVEYPQSWGDVPTEEELQTIVDEYKPFKQWLDELAKFDDKMPRSLEDVIDAVGTANFDPFIVDIYNKKKAVRAKKPTTE